MMVEPLRCRRLRDRVAGGTNQLEHLTDTALRQKLTVRRTGWWNEPTRHDKWEHVPAGARPATSRPIWENPALLSLPR